MRAPAPVLHAPSCTAADDADCRCACGSLLARVVEGGVELKCRRCKRTVLVPLTGATADASSPHRRPALR